MRDKCPFCQRIIEFSEIEVELKCKYCKEKLRSIGVLIVPSIIYKNGDTVWTVDEARDMPQQGVIEEVDYDFDCYTIKGLQYSTYEIYPTLKDCKTECIKRVKDNIKEMKRRITGNKASIIAAEKLIAKSKEQLERM